MKKKLVLVDFNNLSYIVVFSKYIFEKYNGHTAEEITGEHFEELVRDSLKMTIQKVFNILDYNEGYELDILFAKDGYKLWRREQLFQEYKSHRKKTRDASKIDFKSVFKIFDRVWEELKQILPYRFITLDSIEVDDVIYQTIMSEYDKYDRLQIVSRDGDMKQILRHKKVEIYDPKICKFVENIDSEYDLFEKIIHGDKSDGIPNFYTDSITERQKPIFTKDIKKWYVDKNSFKEFLKTQPKEVSKRFIRNKKLIDMRDIPKNILKTIDEALKTPPQEFNLQEYLKTAQKYGISDMTERIGLFSQ